MRNNRVDRITNPNKIEAIVFFDFRRLLQKGVCYALKYVRTMYLNDTSKEDG